MKDDGSLDQTESSGGCEKCQGPAYILKVEPRAFGDASDMGYEQISIFKGGGKALA